MEPSTPTSPTPSVTAPPSTASGLAALLRTGTLTTAQAGKLASANGIKPSDVATSLFVLNQMNPPQASAPQPSPPPAASPTATSGAASADPIVDQQSDEARRAEDLSILNTQFPPATEASQYKIQFLHESPSLPEAHRQAVMQHAQERLLQAGFAPGHGSALAAVAMRAEVVTAGMTAQERETRGLEQWAQLEKTHGKHFEARMKAVHEMIGELDAEKPGLKQYIQDNSVVFDDARVVNALIAQAQLRNLRRGKK